MKYLLLLLSIFIVLIITNSCKAYRIKTSTTTISSTTSAPPCCDAFKCKTVGCYALCRGQQACYTYRQACVNLGCCRYG